jgi:glycosyltransferase involved in cell wall biosynthesis
MSAVHEIRRGERSIERTADRSVTEAPFVSIIVPVYNDPEGLSDTLDTLVGQTYQRDHYEILVVDNRSLDETRAVAADYASRNDNVFALDERRRQSSYAARVRGIRRARGDVLAFVDADMTVERDWLEQAVERMEADELDYMACNVQLYDRDGDQTLASRFNQYNGFPIQKYIDELHFAPTCCLLVRAAVIEEVGPFDVRFISSGDREFGQRVHDAGFEMGYADDIPMYHPARTSVQSLVKKAVRIGRGKHQMRQLYPERYGNPLALLFYPGLYAPTPPSYVRRSVEDWDDLDRGDKARFVALSNGLKLARAYGTVREAVERAVSRE